jgi:hypothetical protein
MRKFLLASAAIVALAIAAPLATAQYTTPPPSPAPYSTPAPSEQTTPQDQTVTPPPDAMATPAPQATQDHTTHDAMAPAQTAEAPPAEPQAQTAEAPTVEAETQTAETQPMDTQAEAMSTPIDMAALEEHARDAGMAGVPMSAADVCAPREIELTTSGSRLDSAKRRQLINAADRASACALQSVVINSPNGSADTARQTLIDHGVDASLIQVNDSDAGGLGVEMNFAGVATSSEQYAAIFNGGQQLAMADTTAMPGEQMSEPAPEGADPNAPSEEQEQPIEPTSYDEPVPSDMNEI